MFHQLRPVTFKPGHFEDTIVVPPNYREIEPRKFVLKIRSGDFRASDRFDTVCISEGTKKARCIWYKIRIGSILCSAAEGIRKLSELLFDGYYKIHGIGMRLQGYGVEDLLPVADKKIDEN